MMTAVFLQILKANGDISWLPTSIGAWVALVVSLSSLAVIFVGYGRWIEKLNGVGGRVKQLEIDEAAAKVERTTTALALRDLIAQNSVLIKELGKHERSTEACREDTEKLGIDLGFKLDGLTREVHGMNDNLSNRLTKVETILEEREGK